MYKRIMVGIDENFASNMVLATAIRMSKQTGGKLAICHALDETILATNEPKSMMNSPMEEVEEKLHASALDFLQEAEKIAKQAGVETEIKLVCSEHDDVAQMLVKAANEWKADLLVVGENESRGLERFFIDSIGESLLRSSNISLLVAHTKSNN